MQFKTLEHNLCLSIKLNFSAATAKNFIDESLTCINYVVTYIGIDYMSEMCRVILIAVLLKYKYVLP